MKVKYKGLFTLVSFLTAMDAAIGVSLAFVFKYIIDLATGNSLDAFITGAYMLLAFVLLSVLVDILNNLAKAKYMEKAMAYIRGSVYRGIFSKDMASYKSKGQGEYISILSNDLKILEEDAIGNVFTLIRYFVSFVIALVSVLVISTPITFLVALFTAIGISVPKLFGNRLSEKKGIYSDALEKLTGLVQGDLNGFEVVKTSNAEKVFYDKFSRVNKDVEKKKRQFQVYSDFVNVIAESIGTIIFVIPIVLGGYLVVTGQVTVGTLIALIQLMNSVTGPLVNGVQIMNKMQSSKVVQSKIRDLMVEDQKAFDNETIDIKSIEFKDVSFSYGDSEIIKDLSWQIEGGKKYAIVGASGCGKSTLLKLLMKYHQLDDGEILINQSDLNNTNDGDLYQSVAYVHQNIALFKGSIDENIRLFKDDHLEGINEVIEGSNLQSVIAESSEGINTNIGDNGDQFSGGERQRMALARALLMDKPLLLLDEATSALDAKTSYEIEKRLLGDDEKTLVVITHKLVPEILNMYDEIVVMDKGMIVEKGSFVDLKERNKHLMHLLNVTKKAS